MFAEGPFTGCKQHQIVLKKQTVDPAISYIKTIVDPAVTVYPIHLEYEVEVVKHTPVKHNGSGEAHMEAQHPRQTVAV